MSVVMQIEYKCLDDIVQICKSHDKCDMCPFHNGKNHCRITVPPSAWNTTKILDTLYTQRTVKGM